MIADESVTDNMISKRDSAEEGDQKLEEGVSDDQVSEGEEEQREPDEGTDEEGTEEDQTEEDPREEDEGPRTSALGAYNVDVFPKGGEGMAGDSDSDPLSRGDDEDDDLDDREDDYMYSRHSIFNTFYDPLPVHKYVNLLGSESGQGRKLKRVGESGDSPPAKSRKVSDDQDSDQEEEEEIEPGVRLCHAVEEGDMEEVVSITSAPNHDPAHLSTRLDPWERTPLMLACRNGNYQIVEHLLGCGASMTEADGLSGSTSLHLCFSDARAPHLEAAKILLSKGSNVDCRNVKQSTPLMWAAMNSSNAWRPDSMAPVRFLVEEAKADLTLKNVNGLTARDIAVKHNWVECAEYLANQEDQEGAPTGPSTGPPAAGWATTEEVGAASPPAAASEA